jgi:hypothetical protein
LLFEWLVFYIEIEALFDVHSARFFGFVEMHVVDFVGFKGECALMTRVAGRWLSHGDLRRKNHMIDEAERIVFRIGLISAVVHGKLSLFNVFII